MAINLLPQDCIVVTPLIPKIAEEIDGKIIDPQYLSRHVMFDDLIDEEFSLYNRPHTDIIEIFEYMKSYIFPIFDRDFKKFIVGGCSAGANFSSLFAVLPIPEA